MERYEVKEVKGDIDYKIDVIGRLSKFHANMLTLHVKRLEDALEKGVLNVVCSAVIEDDAVMGEPEIDAPLEYPLRSEREGIDQVNVSAELPKDQFKQIKEILGKYFGVFTDRSGCTTLVEFKIKLRASDPIRIKCYPFSFNARETVDEEVRKILDLEVTESSDSP